MKDNSFLYQDFSARIHYPTQSAAIITQIAFELFVLNYNWEKPVRALTITASSLVDENKPDQLDLFGNYILYDKQNRLDRAVDSIRNRYGKDIIRNACLCSR